ncbi:alpha/beta fold hydrolase [Noviherbaspirillum sp.]|jgi:polyhydroxyalkanoate synthase|uniref:PHA/PHB synthase family protein n=1 Tax=Noviherbaspirillum sp. TaxID=1926288 RepID=UPI0025D94D6A|nr:alpha/beta fold hydrolase [Noviherbaspirillum sp.]
MPVKSSDNEQQRIHERHHRAVAQRMTSAFDVVPPAWLQSYQDAVLARRIGDRSHLASEFLENLDRSINASVAHLTLGVSPLALASDYSDWISHLAASPGKQQQLIRQSMFKSMRFGQYMLQSLYDRATRPCIEPLPQDRRFVHEGWQRPPYNFLYQSFLLQQQWWDNATTAIRGVSKHDEETVTFVARQFLDIVSPSNFPLINPEVLEATFSEFGNNFLRGAAFFLDDLRRNVTGDRPAGTEAFKVGRNIAVTPGKVVFRNRLIELIQYAPTTDRVQGTPVLLQSAWMMKYYIMDLSPHNSLVKYLVDRGHTVFAISWLNPGPDDRDLGMEDYRRLGTMAGLDSISAIFPGTKIHAVGYCLGGILLAIAAAAMARDGDDRLKTVTLLTTMTDFTETGELGIFMDPSEVAFLEDMMWQQGYMDGKRVGGGFQLMRSRDLIWSKMVREYFLGRREPMSDLMAWNADGTRMPYRQHSELMRRLYRDNELFEGHYVVDGHPIHLGDIQAPIFCVAAERDHVAPWRAVFKLHLQTEETELTFVLSSGGHNVGIVNPPGQSYSSYRIAVREKDAVSLDPETWQAQTPVQEGSWWPAWEAWLTRHSSSERLAPLLLGTKDKKYSPRYDAPGKYVHVQ